MFIRGSLVFSLNGLFKMVIVISGETSHVLYRYVTNNVTKIQTMSIYSTMKLPYFILYLRCINVSCNVKVL